MKKSNDRMKCDVQNYCHGESVRDIFEAELSSCYVHDEHKYAHTKKDIELCNTITVEEKYGAKIFPLRTFCNGERMT